MFRTKDHSSQPKGPRSDSTSMTKNVTGRSSRLEVNRADSVRRAKVCTERRADSDCKEPTRSINRADSKMSELTRTTHTDRITASFFSLSLFQNLKRLDFKSQRSESWKLSLKAHEAPLNKKKKKKKRKKRKKRDCSLRKTLNPIKYPRRAKEKPKYISSPHPNQKATWRIRRRSSEAQEALQQNLLQGISSCNNLTMRVCLLVASYLTFLCVRFLVSLWNQVRFLVSLWNQVRFLVRLWNQVRFLVSLWNQVRFLVSLWNQVRFLVSLWNQVGLSYDPCSKQLYCIPGVNIVKYQSGILGSGCRRQESFEPL